MAIRKKLPQLKKVNPITKSKQVNSVSELRKKYKGVPLYFLFGINKEIDLQCPILDEYLMKLEEVKTALENIRKCKNLDMAKIHAVTALYSMNDIPDGIDLGTRVSFEKLRITAEDWKQLAIRAMNETQTPERFLKI